MGLKRLSGTLSVITLNRKTHLLTSLLSQPCCVYTLAVYCNSNFQRFIKHLKKINKDWKSCWKLNSGDMVMWRWCSLFIAYILAFYFWRLIKVVFIKHTLLAEPELQMFHQTEQCFESTVSTLFYKSTCRLTHQLSLQIKLKKKKHTSPLSWRERFSGTQAKIPAH